MTGRQRLVPRPARRSALTNVPDKREEQSSGEAAATSVCSKPNSFLPRRVPPAESAGRAVSGHWSSAGGDAAAPAKQSTAVSGGQRDGGDTVTHVTLLPVETPACFCTCL